jgi:Protein of unknown function (DUF2924)
MSRPRQVQVEAEIGAPDLSFHRRSKRRSRSSGACGPAREAPGIPQGLSGDPAGAGARAEATAPDPIDHELARLADLDIHALRVRWRKLFRTTAPPHIPRYLLLRIIAYRIQANAYGDLDRQSVRFLEKIARESEARRASGEKRRGVPPVPPVEQRRSMKPGTVLVREHGGTMHRVTVLADGFAWDGVTYRSLSEVARAITGTNWNGPRFFGLRDKTKQSRSAGEGPRS